MWECEWWTLYKTTNTVKKHIREGFLYRRSLAAEQILEDMKEGKLRGYMQCDIEVPEKLMSKFVNFPLKFKNTSVINSDFGDLMKNHVEEERLLSQPRKVLISSFTLQNGTLITLLLLFYLQLCLVCTKKHRFVEYTIKKCFNSLVQSAVDAGRQGALSRCYVLFLNFFLAALRVFLSLSTESAPWEYAGISWWLSVFRNTCNENAIHWGLKNVHHTKQNAHLCPRTWCSQVMSVNSHAFHASERQIHCHEVNSCPVCIQSLHQFALSASGCCLLLRVEKHFEPEAKRRSFLVDQILYNLIHA